MQHLYFWKHLHQHQHWYLQVDVLLGVVQHEGCGHDRHPPPPRLHHRRHQLRHQLPHQGLGGGAVRRGGRLTSLLEVLQVGSGEERRREEEERSRVEVRRWVEEERRQVEEERRRQAAPRSDSCPLS